MSTSGNVRQLAFQEMGRIFPLFRLRFGTDISDAMLAWKYGDGRGRSYGFFSDDGVLLTHCGIFYRQALADGEPCRIAQLGDLMALPGGYGGLSRGGSPFAVMIRQILDDLPDDLNPGGLAFGFPSDRAMRLGEKLGLFTAIDQMCELTFEPLSHRSHSERCIPIIPSEESAAQVINQLWGQMAASLGNELIGVRDAAYLVRRYERHPHNRYQCRLVRSRWLRQPLGLLVTRIVNSRCELLDIIAAPDVVPKLVRVARRSLGEWGATSLTLWLTERHAVMLNDQAAACNRLEFRIMANPFSSDGHPERFAGCWWLTGGDTDYR